MRLHSSLLALLLAAGGAAQAQTEQTDQTGGVMVFGDSNVEMGNLYAVPGLERPAGAPYFSRGGFSRESNGPVWAEQLYAGLAPVADPSASPTARNYAYSGATTGAFHSAGELPFGVLSQVEAFAADLRAGRARVDAATRHVIDAGSNDYLEVLNAGGGAPDLAAVPARVAANRAAAVRRLAGLGARRFLVTTLPGADFTSDPIRAYLGPELLALGRGLYRETDAATRAEIARIHAELPQVDVVLGRLDLIEQAMFANPAAFGFRHAGAPCHVQSTGALCATSADAQNQHLFFDETHMTTKAAGYVARYLGALVDESEGRAHLRVGETSGAVLGSMDELSWLVAAGEGGELPTTRSADGSFVFTSLSESEEAREDAGGRRLGERRSRTWVVGVSGEAAPGLRVTAAGGRLTGGFSADDADVDLEGWGGSVRLRTQAGFAWAAAGASGAWYDVQSRRSFDLPTFEARGDTSAYAYRAEIAAGADLPLGPIELSPTVQAHWAQARVKGFAETGAAGLDMRFGRQLHTSVRAAAGVTARATLAVAGLQLRPSLGVFYDARLSGAPDGFRGEILDNTARPLRTNGLPEERRRLEVRPGLTFAGETLSASVGGAFGDGRDRLALNLAVRF